MIVSSQGVLEQSCVTVTPSSYIVREGQEMFPLGTHFEELLKNIRQPQERFDAARDLPPLVRN